MTTITPIRREPTPDEQRGMAWFNSLSPEDRGLWLHRSKGASAAEAWACYQRLTAPSIDTSAVLAEQSVAEARVIAEHHARFDTAVTVSAGAEVRMLVGIANDFEAHGDVPQLVWMRDANARITGITLVGHLSPDTVARMRELKYEPVTP